VVAFRSVMTDTSHRLIVSLDLDNLDQTLKLVEELSPVVHYFKVGPIPFIRYGDRLLNRLGELHKKVFLDLKWHDIPNTVKGAVKAASENSTIFMMNVHCSGGEAMLKAAVEAQTQSSHQPLLIGVTVLTSLKDDDLHAIGVSNSVSGQALKLAQLAKKAGLNGVVASAHEASILKKTLGKAFCVVTPGIRPAWSVKTDDQKRVLTPLKALEMGADYLVVGRPIIAHQNPLYAAKQILEEMEQLQR
jgi:orotidine-5'-phosphate decarboxylase